MKLLWIFKDVLETRGGDTSKLLRNRDKENQHCCDSYKEPDTRRDI